MQFSTAALGSAQNRMLNENRLQTDSKIDFRLDRTMTRSDFMVVVHTYVTTTMRVPFLIPSVQKQNSPRLIRMTYIP